MNSEHPHVVIFTGPSLSADAARKILDATYHAPIRRGDIDTLLQQPAAAPEIIGIIDGVFFQDFAISPKEVLRAIDAGIEVYGSSSMGALRAAELYSYGMKGIGRIYDLYRTSTIDADDEVAMTFDGDMFNPTSVPLVNIRCALADAVHAQVIQARDRDVLMGELQSVYFPHRTLGLLHHIAKKHLPTKRAEALRQFYEKESPDAKASDARLLLQAVRDRLYGPVSSVDSSHLVSNR